jgi:hypothetical protein
VKRDVIYVTGRPCANSSAIACQGMGWEGETLNLITASIQQVESKRRVAEILFNFKRATAPRFRLLLA